MQCSQSFQDYLVECPNGIKVNIVAEVGPYADLQWQIDDKFGNQYTGQVITNGNGGFTIPVSDLPAGLLTSHSGSFDLRVVDLDNQCRPVPLLVAGYYDAITFDVKRGNKVKDTLGCFVACIGASVEIFTGNGVQTVFVMENYATPGNETVYVDDIPFSSPDDYVLSGYNLIFSDAPLNGQEIRIEF